MRRPIAILALAVLALTVSASDVDAQTWTGRWEVKVTNLTTMQVMTPFLVATHTDAARLFTPGMAASGELEALAEGGDTMPLQMALEGMSSVMSVSTGTAMTPPGNGATLQINGSGTHRYVSVASMLVPTNDAFVGTMMELPTTLGRASVSYAYAWDAGTEANDESCASIPGAPMWSECEDASTEASTDMGEGFIAIHNGITGIGDFGASRDWKNPVAMITVTRIQ